MDENNLQNEEETRKLLMRKRLRIFLIILNLVLLAELTYGLIRIVHKEIQNSRSCLVTSKINKNMDQYRFNNIAVRDYIVYGDSLSVFRYDYDYEGSNDYFIKDNAKFILKDLCQNKEYSFSPSSYLDQNIKLFSLDKGNYFIFYQDGDNQSLLTYETFDENLNYSFYSFPYKKYAVDKNYNRKKITISHVMSNAFPLMSISVEEEKYIPEETGYDLALNYDENEQIKSITLKLKDKLEAIGFRVLLSSNSPEYSYSEETKNIRNIYDSGAKFAIKLQKSDSSNLTFYRSSKIKGYMPIDEANDEYHFIKQLGGRSLQAGICNETSSLVSCGIGNKKMENGINSLVISIPDLSDNESETLINNLFNSLIKLQ